MVLQLEAKIKELDAELHKGTLERNQLQDDLGDKEDEIQGLKEATDALKGELQELQI